MEFIELNTLRTKRKHWLDALKGAAIILVVISHSQPLPYVHGHLTACYMCLFFIASGYTYKAKPAAIKKKCKQLLTPYFGWCLFYLFCEFSLKLIKSQPFDNELFKLWGGGIIFQILDIPINAR